MDLTTRTATETAALNLFDRAADVLELEPDLRVALALPERETAVRFPVRMDDGRVRMFNGYRVRHSTARGPAKGGLRYDLSVSLPQLRQLAMAMTLKSALVGLPFGGSKGGVIVDPGAHSAAELERLTRRLVRALGDDIGPDRDIPAPDAGTNARVMSWIFDEYAQLHGRPIANIVTGKPTELGGSPIRSGATGIALAELIEAAASRIELPLRGANVALQGFGNVGYAAARALRGMGARVIAIADIGGGVIRTDGIDLKSTQRWAAETGTVAGAPGTELIPAADVLALPVDVLVLAALEGQITRANASTVHARLLAEGANGPTQPDADRILRDNNVFVLPDILANAGGVTASYLEWSGQSLSLSEEQAQGFVRGRLHDALTKVLDQAAQLGGDTRLAAHVLALKAVAAAARSRGVS